jgi:hypothetical protein
MTFGALARVLALCREFWRLGAISAVVPCKYLIWSFQDLRLATLDGPINRAFCLWGVMDTIHKRAFSTSP